MSYHPNFSVGQLNWWFTNWCFTTIKYPMIQSRKMAWNLKHCTPQKKVAKSSSKCLFWGSKSRFSQRGVTVFQPCMLMLKGFLWLMVQVSEMFLSHDIQMRQARPWRPRHRPCLFDNTAPPRAFHLEISETTRQASSDTFLGGFLVTRYRDTEIHTSQFYCSHLFFFNNPVKLWLLLPQPDYSTVYLPVFGKAICNHLYISQLFDLDLKLALILRKKSSTFDQSRSSTFSKKPTETPPKWTANWGCMLLSTSSRMPQMLHQEKSFQRGVLGSQNS